LRRGSSSEHPCSLDRIPTKDACSRNTCRSRRSNNTTRSCDLSSRAMLQKWRNAIRRSPTASRERWPACSATISSFAAWMRSPPLGRDGASPSRAIALRDWRGLLAATHGEEIPFVFGAPYLKLFGSQQSPADGDAVSRARDAEARQRLSQALSTAWTAFAAKGFQTMRPCQHGRATRPANRSWRSGEASPPSLHRR
jgi:hypothetical protein